MAIDKKQQIRGTRVFLTVFYGFLLSSVLFRYIIHGIVEATRRPSNPYAIIMILLGFIILISIGLAIYATWFDNTMIMLVSGIVLICVFVLTLIICIFRIVKTAPHRLISAITTSCVAIIPDGSSNADQPAFANKVASTLDVYTRAEDVTKLIIELIFILFAIIATFILYRYMKTKYAAVPTVESKPS